MIRKILLTFLFSFVFLGISYSQEILVIDCNSNKIQESKQDTTEIMIFDMPDSVINFHKKRKLSYKNSSKVAPKYLLNLVNSVGKYYGIDPKLLLAVIEVESGFNPNAVSPVGAVGLMQLMPDTGSAMRAVNLFDPEENVIAGAKYLSIQLNKFGSLELALAAYNAGPGAVEKYDGIPPYDETMEYVDLVIDIYTSLK